MGRHRDRHRERLIKRLAWYQKQLDRTQIELDKLDYLDSVNERLRELGDSMTKSTEVVRNAAEKAKKVFLDGSG